tara:strand:- start:4834 stop:5907 length:1074 start_codon:yes stop_codon:yes gene_type:complete
MFDVTTVISKMYKLVGLRQPFNPTYAILDADNITSTSGLYSNRSDNPYVKVEYLKECQDYVAISNVEFNQLLKEGQESAIVSVCTDVFSSQDARQTDMVYSYAMNKVNTTSLESGWVGYKLKVTRLKDVAFEIPKITLDFEGTGDITIQLYNSNKQTPLLEQIVTITDTTQEVELDWVVNNSGDTYKGDYYLGYVVNGALTPFKRDYENSNIKNGFCDLSIEDVQFKGHTGSTIFDLTTNDGLSDYTGLNPTLVVYDDYTDTIVKNKKLFARAIDLQFQISLMRTYQGSLRSNKDQRKAQEVFNAITIAIEGLDQDGAVKVQGANAKLFGEIENIRREVLKIQGGVNFQGITTGTFT